MDKIDFTIERLILKNGNLINNVRDDDLRAYGLTSAQSETILYYAAHADASIKDLALHLSISHQAARKLVDKLKAKGYLTVAPSQADKRCSNVSLTQTGQALCAELKSKGFSVGNRILVGFSAGEKEQLLGYLQRIEKTFEES